MGEELSWSKSPDDMTRGELAEFFARLLGPDATIKGTPMVPIHQATLTQIVGHLKNSHLHEMTMSVGDGQGTLFVYGDQASINAARANVTRVEDLHLALRLALGWLIQHEPGDSRAVSDEFVAMADIESGPGENAEVSRKIIREAIARLPH